jgi:hypothetical protein
MLHCDWSAYGMAPRARIGVMQSVSPGTDLDEYFASLK